MSDGSTTVTSVSEVIKLILSAYIAYLQQKGMTEEEIDAAFDEAVKGLALQDPALIPNPKPSPDGPGTGAR